MLVREANQRILCKKDPTQTPPLPKSVSDAYLTWFGPLGILGKNLLIKVERVYKMLISADMMEDGDLFELIKFQYFRDRFYWTILNFETSVLDNT